VACIPPTSSSWTGRWRAWSTSATCSPAAWVLLPAGAATRFFDAYAYAEADEATVRRARGLAALKSLFLMLMGQNGDRGLPGGKPLWGPAGRAALDRILSEPLPRRYG
jgi:hypothetical protein